MNLSAARREAREKITLWRSDPAALDSARLRAASVAYRIAYRNARKNGADVKTAHAAGCRACATIDNARRGVVPSKLISDLWASARRRSRGTAGRRRPRPLDENAKPKELPAVCPFTGFEISLRQPRRDRGPRRPSIDAIDPSKGYVEGNVQIISTWANSMKGQLSVDEAIAFCLAVVLHRGVGSSTADLISRLNIPPPLRNALLAKLDITKTTS